MEQKGYIEESYEEWKENGFRDSLEFQLYVKFVVSLSRKNKL